MKKHPLKKTLIAMLFAAMGFAPSAQAAETPAATPAATQGSDKAFEEMFTQIEPKAMREKLSQLMLQEEHTVITAGTESRFNSMMASWEALVRYFDKPMTFCFLGAERFTLEFMKDRQTYTMSFFPKSFTDQTYAFGTSSGRDSDKMQTTTLTAVKTPSGNMTYKEAGVVIECSLFEITTVQPDDFYTEEGKKFVETPSGKPEDYHKLVFGTITNIWIKK